jgi:transglutaminase-like putative cysteine protease
VPEPDVLDTVLDSFGNEITQVGVHRAHDELVIESTSTVEFTPPQRPVLDTPWEEVRDRAEGLLGRGALEVAPFVGSSPFISIDDHRAGLYALASAAFPPGLALIEGLAALCHGIFTSFEFDPSFSELSTPLGAVLTARRGVCQDFAHLSVGALRTLGLPARYVSGYIETDPPDGEPRTFGADASHAWCSAWLGDGGWLDFDPTNDHLPSHRHVTVGWGRDYADVTPVRGVVIGPSAAQTLDVNVDVSRAV